MENVSKAENKEKATEVGTTIEEWKQKFNRDVFPFSSANEKTPRLCPLRKDVVILQSMNTGSACVS